MSRPLAFPPPHAASLLARWLLALLTLTSALGAAAPLLERQNLFEENTNGIVSFRIPGIVVTAKGTVLAYCEARKLTGQDWGEIEIHLRRSTDGGRTFSAPRQIAHVGPRIPRNPVISEHTGKKSVGGPDEQTVNNPMLIADRDGTVHFVYCVEYMRAFYARSTDDGVTWSKPTEITAAFEEFRPAWPWRTIAAGPGHGIQLRTGRLIIPVWIAKAKDAPHANAVASTIYSDDRGTTWHASEIAVPNDTRTSGTSESIAVELSDGRVALYARTRSKPDRKVVAISPDGATGWTKPTFVEALFEPVCMSGIVSYPGAKPRLLFSNPHTLELNGVPGKPGERRDRKNLSIKLSYDNGRTWPANKTLELGPSAYSDLAVLPDGTVLCLFESGRGIPSAGVKPWPYAFITLARFNLEWLTDGRDASTPAAAAR